MSDRFICGGHLKRTVEHFISFIDNGGFIDGPGCHGDDWDKLFNHSVYTWNNYWDPAYCACSDLSLVLNIVIKYINHNEFYARKATHDQKVKIKTELERLLDPLRINGVKFD